MALSIQSSVQRVNAAADLSRCLQDVVREQEDMLQRWKATQSILSMFGVRLNVTSFNVKHSDSMEMSSLRVSLDVGQQLADVLHAYEAFLSAVRWHETKTAEGAGKTAAIVLSGLHLTVTVLARAHDPNVTLVTLSDFAW